MLDRAGERDPIEDLRAAGIQLVARQVAQEFCVLVGAGLEDGAVEILVDQEMAQPPEASTPTRASPGNPSTALRTAWPNS